jgi:hypothetical protein
MSDNQFAAYEAKCAAMAALEAEHLPANKASLFNALAAAGIATVIVGFDGYGDSGQIETIDAFGPDNTEAQLPEATIAMAEVTFDGPRVVIEQRSPRDVIENMAYAFLEQTHDGWENDDGAYGEFTFDVAARSIALDYNERYIATNRYQHEF